MVEFFTSLILIDSAEEFQGFGAIKAKRTLGISTQGGMDTHIGGGIDFMGAGIDFMGNFLKCQTP